MASNSPEPAGEPVVVKKSHENGPADVTDAEAPPTEAASDNADAAPKPAPKSAAFWLVFISLCLSAFTANLNATILSTVVPVIVREIGAGTSYIWINAAYTIAAATIQPMCGQISNIYGRRYPMLISLAAFTVGSGICGGANSLAMLVAGRTVQGLGGGGIMMLMEVIVSDLLPQRERAQYLGIVLSTGSLAVLIGPTIGGAFATKASWRWCFYINVPVGGIGFILATFFLKLKAPKHETWEKSLRRVDFIGNILFMAATCAILVGLVMGGQLYPWSSWRIIVPIVLGFVGWFFFGAYEVSPWCKEPTMPARIFSNRTAVTGFIINFISTMLLEWVVYYLPYYFQALKGSSQLFSSVQVLPFNVFLIPSAIISGGVIAKTGKYKPVHFAGFVFSSLASGLFSMMDSRTHVAEWVFYQLFMAFGLGSLIMSVLPAIQASLPESDVATSTGVHAFLRSFGFVWGFTIPSLVFNNEVRRNLYLVEDPEVRAAVARGGAYEQADSPLLRSLEGVSKEQTLRLYTVSLQRVWYTALAFSLLGFLLVFVERSLKLREELGTTDFGLEEGSKNTDVEKKQTGKV